MGKIDEAKEFIGFLKAVFVVLIAIDTSLIAWIFKSYESESTLRLYIVVLLVLIVSVAIAILFARILNEIKRLKDL